MYCTGLFSVLQASLKARFHLLHSLTERAPVNLTHLQTYRKGRAGSRLQLWPACKMRSALQLAYCDRPFPPSGPGPSHRGGSGGDVRHSCSRAGWAAWSPAAGRRPLFDPRTQTSLHPSSCSEEEQLWINGKTKEGRIEVKLEIQSALPRLQ